MRKWCQTYEAMLSVHAFSWNICCWEFYMLFLNRICNVFWDLSEHIHSLSTATFRVHFTASRPPSKIENLDKGCHVYAGNDNTDSQIGVTTLIKVFNSGWKSSRSPHRGEMHFKRQSTGKVNFRRMGKISFQFQALGIYIFHFGTRISCQVTT